MLEHRWISDAEYRAAVSRSVDFVGGAVPEPPYPYYLRALRSDTTARLRDGREVWTGSMHTDLVTRLDPKTNAMTQYLLPRTTNIRRVFVEETGPRPVLWVGSNHGASIVRVEPLD